MMTGQFRGILMRDSADPLAFVKILWLFAELEACLRCARQSGELRSRRACTMRMLQVIVPVAALAARAGPTSAVGGDASVVKSFGHAAHALSA